MAELTRLRPEDPKSQQTGLHGEQLAGRTQQAFFQQQKKRTFSTLTLAKSTLTNGPSLMRRPWSRLKST